MVSRVPGTFKQQPGTLRRDISANGAMAEKWLLDIGALVAERYLMGECTVMLAREPMGGQYRWHLSISHPARYPTWDEVKTPCYVLGHLSGVVMAQVLGLGGPWVNVAENCFHLYELRDEAFLPEVAE